MDQRPRHRHAALGRQDSRADLRSDPFELTTIKLDGFEDCRGRPIFSVAARHIPDERAERMHAKELDDEDRLLIAMQKNPGGSIRDFAMACGWTNGATKRLVNRVQLRLRTMQTKGLVVQDRKNKWRLTPKGRKEADLLP